MSDDLSLALQREVQLRRQGNIAQAAAEKEKAASLQRQLSELDQQLSGLQVYAERDGLVTSADIDRLRGTYVHAGDELVRISDPNEKELLVTISQHDAGAYQSAVGAITKVRLRGGTQLFAITQPLRPRARQSLPHPALSAASGGPLAVEPSTDEEATVRLVQPQLESVVPLDPVTSSTIHAGQIGMMTVNDNRSLMARLVDSFWPDSDT